MHSDDKNNISLGSRLAVGIGDISYNGKSVLDSDGEAFHLSGRYFDSMSDSEVLRIKTPDERINDQIAIILTSANIIINQWTTSQSEVIYLAIDGYTQNNMAKKLGIQQGAVNNRLKVANSKTIQEGIDYIIQLVKE